MDFFSIGTTIKNMMGIYYINARHTGRTTALIDSLSDDDVVCCLNAAEADRLKRICRERNIKAEFISISPQNPARLFEKMKGRRVVKIRFEHSWIEAFYNKRIDDIIREVEYLEALGRE